MTTTLAGAGGSIFVFMGPHPFSAPNDILRRARSYSYCSSAHRQQQQHAGTRWLGRAGRGAAGRVALQVNAAYCLHTFLFDMLLGTAACGILSVGAQQSVPLLGSKSFFSCRHTESSTVEAGKLLRASDTLPPSLPLRDDAGKAGISKPPPAMPAVLRSQLCPETYSIDL
jgi:hypothetical protein